MVQNTSVQGEITFLFIGLEVISSILLIVMLFFLNVEKNIEKELKEILERHSKQ